MGVIASKPCTSQCDSDDERSTPGGNQNSNHNNHLTLHMSDQKECPRLPYNPLVNNNHTATAAAAAATTQDQAPPTPPSPPLFPRTLDIVHLPTHHHCSVPTSVPPTASTAATATSPRSASDHRTPLHALGASCSATDEFLAFSQTSSLPVATVNPSIIAQHEERGGGGDNGTSTDMATMLEGRPDESFLAAGGCGECNSSTSIARAGYAPLRLCGYDSTLLSRRGVGDDEDASHLGSQSMASKWTLMQEPGEVSVNHPLRPNHSQSSLASKDQRGGGGKVIMVAASSQASATPAGGGGDVPLLALATTTVMMGVQPSAQGLYPTQRDAFDDGDHEEEGSLMIL